MIVLLLLVIVWNARKLVSMYYHERHWTKGVIPGFLMGVAIPMVVELLANYAYFGSSLWVPDYKCPDFRWLSKG